MILHTLNKNIYRASSFHFWPLQLTADLRAEMQGGILRNISCDRVIIRFAMYLAVAVKSFMNKYWHHKTHEKSKCCQEMKKRIGALLGAAS